MGGGDGLWYLSRVGGTGQGASGCPAESLLLLLLSLAPGINFPSLGGTRMALIGPCLRVPSFVHSLIHPDTFRRVPAMGSLLC